MLGSLNQFINLALANSDFYNIVKFINGILKISMI